MSFPWRIPAEHGRKPSPFPQDFPSTLIPVFAGKQMEGDLREAGEEGGAGVEALSAEQKKLDSGPSTPFVVLQLQRDLTTARQSEIAALTDYLRLASALSLAEGTLLQRHHLDLDTSPAEP